MAAKMVDESEIIIKNSLKGNAELFSPESHHESSEQKISSELIKNNEQFWSSEIGLDISSLQFITNIDVKEPNTDNKISPELEECNFDKDYNENLPEKPIVLVIPYCGELNEVTELKTSEISYTQNEISEIVLKESNLSSKIYDNQNIDKPFEITNITQNLELVNTYVPRKEIIEDNIDNKTKYNIKKSKTKCVVEPAPIFECPICLKIFKYYHLLIRHQAVHSKKIHKCEVCGKEFGDSSNLRKHSLIHADLKPFSCDICGKEFRFSNGLKRHTKIHSKEKPYECENCGEKFAESGNMNVHIKRYHTGELEIKRKWKFKGVTQYVSKDVLIESGKTEDCNKDVHKIRKRCKKIEKNEISLDNQKVKTGKRKKNLDSTNEIPKPKSKINKVSEKSKKNSICNKNEKNLTIISTSKEKTGTKINSKPKLNKTLENKELKKSTKGIKRKANNNESIENKSKKRKLNSKSIFKIDNTDIIKNIRDVRIVLNKNEVEEYMSNQNEIKNLNKDFKNNDVNKLNNDNMNESISTSINKEIQRLTEILEDFEKPGINIVEQFDLSKTVEDNLYDQKSEDSIQTSEVQKSNLENILESSLMAENNNSKLFIDKEILFDNIINTSEIKNLFSGIEINDGIIEDHISGNNTPIKDNESEISTFVNTSEDFCNDVNKYTNQNEINLGFENNNIIKHNANLKEGMSFENVNLLKDNLEMVENEIIGKKNIDSILDSSLMKNDAEINLMQNIDEDSESDNEDSLVIDENIFESLMQIDEKEPDLMQNTDEKAKSDSVDNFVLNKNIFESLMQIDEKEPEEPNFMQIHTDENSRSDNEDNLIIDENILETNSMQIDDKDLMKNDEKKSEVISQINTEEFSDKQSQSDLKESHINLMENDDSDLESDTDDDNEDIISNNSSDMEDGDISHISRRISDEGSLDYILQSMQKAYPNITKICNDDSDDFDDDDIVQGDWEKNLQKFFEKQKLNKQNKTGLNVSDDFGNDDNISDDDLDKSDEENEGDDISMEYLQKDINFSKDNDEGYVLNENIPDDDNIDSEDDGLEVEMQNEEVSDSEEYLGKFYEQKFDDSIQETDSDENYDTSDEDDISDASSVVSNQDQEIIHHNSMKFIGDKIVSEECEVQN